MTAQAMEQPENRKFTLADELIARAKIEQPAILDDMLKSGIPLTFSDDEGNFMQKNPDGSIEVLQRSVCGAK